MPVQCISYDLSKPGRQYEDLYEEIKNLGSWWNCTESVWLVDTTRSATQVRDRLKTHLDQNDRIAVFQLQGPWAAAGLSDKCAKWLRTHL